MGADAKARSTKEVEPNSGSIQYGIYAAPGPAFSTGNLPATVGTNGALYAGTLTLGSAPCSATAAGAANPSAGTGVVNSGTYYCNIVVQSGTSYVIQMNLKNTTGPTLVANSSVPASGVNGLVPFGPLSPGTTTQVAVEMLPYYATSTLQNMAANQPAAQSVATTQFYEDSLTAAESYNLQENVLDAAGGIITTYYGAVHGYPTLTLSATAGTTNGVVTALPLTFGPAAPATQYGNNAVALTYDAANGTNDPGGSTTLQLSSSGPQTAVNYNVNWVLFGIPGAAATYAGVSSGTGFATDTSGGPGTYAEPAVNGTHVATITAGQAAYFPTGSTVLVSDGTNDYVGTITAGGGTTTPTITLNTFLLPAVGGATIGANSKIQNVQVVTLGNTGVNSNVSVEEETTSAVTTGLDTSLTASLGTTGSGTFALPAATTCAGATDLKINGLAPAASYNTAQVAGPPSTAVVNLQIQANPNFTSSVCILKLASPNSAAAATPSALATYVAILFPATAQTSITSHSRH